MRKTFPRKRAGDQLSAPHVNALSDVCRGLTSGSSLSNLSRMGYGLVGKSEHIHRTVIVTDVLEEGNETCVGALYRVKVRYYDHTNEEWTEGGNKYCLDASQFGDRLAEGDTVQAWWDPQRNMFVGARGFEITIVELIDDFSDAKSIDNSDTSSAWIIGEDLERKNYDPNIGITSGEQIEVHAGFFTGYKFGIQGNVANRGEYLATIQLNSAHYAISSGHHVIWGAANVEGLTQPPIFAGEIGTVYNFQVLTPGGYITLPELEVYAITDYVNGGEGGQLLLHWSKGRWHLQSPCSSTLLGKAVGSIAQGTTGTFKVLTSPGSTETGRTIVATARSAAFINDDLAYISRVAGYLYPEAVPAVC